MSKPNVRKILVTGSNGHLGCHVVRQLLDEGAHVVALLRERSDRRSLEGLEGRAGRLELRVGDVLDAGSLDRAAVGCEGIIHTAANYATWARDEREIHRPNVEGTANVLRCAARAGIRRVVCTSSCVAAGVSEGPDQLRTEEDWSPGSSMVYQQSKLDGEREAQRLAAELGLELVTILPTLVLGPRDYRITPSTEAIRDLANGKAPTFEGGLNIVSVSDVAAAHVAALRSSVDPGRYLVGGENLTVRQVGALLAERTGRQPKHLALPRPVLLALAAVLETGARLTRRPPGMTRAFVREVIGKYGWFDCSKARTGLGLQPTPAAAVLAETVEWLSERGELDRGATRLRDRPRP